MLVAFFANIKSFDWTSGLIRLYVLSLGFLLIFDLPIVGTKIQPPELIFGIILILFILRSSWFCASSTTRPLPLKGNPPARVEETISRVGGFPFRGQGRVVQKSLLLYFLAITISCFFALQWTSWLEWLGLIYLLLLYFVFKYLLKSAKINLKKFVIDSFTWMGLIAAFLGILGWVLARFGLETPLAVQPDSYYPYLGYIGRAQGFTTNPNMLMSLLAVAFLLKFSDVIEKLQKERESWFSRDFALLFFIGIGAILTFSKTFLLLIIGCLLVWYLHLKEKTFWKKGFVITSGISLFIIFNFGAHVAVFNKNEIDWEALKKEAYTADAPFAEIGEHYLIATNYLINKESATLAGIRHFPWGVGPGGHNNFVAKLKQEGLYPEYFSNYDPHSTYFGAWGEAGLFGLLALLILFVVIGRTAIKALNRVGEERKALIIGLAACFLYVAMEATTTDIMNFRHFWVLLAVFQSEAGSSQVVLYHSKNV